MFWQYAYPQQICNQLATLGRMLRETPRNTGAAGIGPIAVLKENRNLTPTLADMGLSKKTSKLAQDIASLPEMQKERLKKGYQFLDLFLFVV